MPLYVTLLMGFNAFLCIFCLFLGAGHSSADAHCPQIDTQQLDRQIKAIMTEVIPFLKVSLLYFSL